MPKKKKKLSLAWINMLIYSLFQEWCFKVCLHLSCWSCKYLSVRHCQAALPKDIQKEKVVCGLYCSLFFRCVHDDESQAFAVYRVRQTVLTYECDPHGESCAVNTEVLENVIFHETQDGETWSITCVVNLQKDIQVQVKQTAGVSIRLLMTFTYSPSFNVTTGCAYRRCEITSRSFLI